MLNAQPGGTPSFIGRLDVAAAVDCVQVWQLTPRNILDALFPKHAGPDGGGNGATSALAYIDDDGFIAEKGGRPCRDDI